MRRQAERRVPPTPVVFQRERGPSHEEIAALAHQRYLERGAVDGRDLDDWLAAERELTKNRRKFATA